jgi:hypothetical protein
LFLWPALQNNRLMDYGIASICALVTLVRLSAALPQLRLPGGSSSDVTTERSLQQTQCRAVALRLLPPPAIRNYTQCFQDKLRPTSSHDWSVPGAEVSAQLECWCQHNVTQTMQEYGCCDHSDIYPMCSVQCPPDCSSALAQMC